MKYYKKSFYLERPVGNNAFSYDSRTCRRIRIAAFADKREFRIEQGNSPAFIEVDEGEERAFAGLADFVRIREKGRNSYIFDNHNHAFYLIFQELLSGGIPRGLPLIHFDQHKDMRVPPLPFSEMKERDREIRDFLREVCPEEAGSAPLSDEDRAFFYTNAVLNVGNFLVPLLEEKLISEAVIMDSSAALMRAEELSKSLGEWILDIDLDFFSEEMDYLSYEWKIDCIRKFLPGAGLITICTSPYFVEFERAKTALWDIFEREERMKLL